MYADPRPLRLRDGRQALLRTPDPERDAAGLVRFQHDTAQDVPYVLRCPEEITMSVAGEESFLEAVIDSDEDLMLLCEADGQIAGTCHVSFMTRQKTRHRCTIALAIRKALWGQGIGTAMIKAMIEAAERVPHVTLMELEYVEGNERARRLYERMGFRAAGVHPCAIRQSDGSLCALHLMQREISHNHTNERQTHENS